MQSCPTLSDPMDCSLPGVHGIFQARALEWIAIAFSIKLALSTLECAGVFKRGKAKELGFRNAVLLRTAGIQLDGQVQWALG